MGEIGGKLIGGSVDTDPAVVEADLVPGMVVKGLFVESDTGGNSRRHPGGPRQGGKKGGMFVTVTLP